MKRTGIYQRILSLAICLAIALAWSVTAIALDDNAGFNLNSHSEEHEPVTMDAQAISEEEDGWCIDCSGGFVHMYCLKSNVLLESYTHTYGSNQRCTIEAYGSKYYYRCDMYQWTGCVTTFDEYLHNCYYRHLSCGKGIEDFCFAGFE